MNLNTLPLFIAVVQNGSFSRTAERLSLPIATISRQISELENDLDIQLFDRTKTGVKPTMAGQQLYEEIFQSVDNLTQITQAVRANQGEVKGRLRISTSPGTEEIWDWIDAFGKQHPKVVINLQVTDRVLDLVEDNIDFAFRMGDLHTESVVARRVMTVRAKWIAHPSVLARFGAPTTPEELAHMPIVAWAKNEQRASQVLVGDRTLELPYSFASNDIYAIAHAIRNGRGVGLLSENHANRLIRECNLVEVLPDYPMKDVAVHMLHVRHRHPSVLMRAFMAFIDEKVKAA